MFGRSTEYDPRIARITRQLAAIESDLEDISVRAGRRASSGVASAQSRLAETVAPYLSSIAERLSQSQDYAADRASALQRGAMAAGGEAVDRLAEQTNGQPLLMLAVAFGVGLLVGSVARR